MITGIQIIALFFCLLMIYQTFLHVKKGEINGLEGYLFFALWIAAGFLTIFPASADFILKTFQINRLLDLATVIGFMVLIGVSYENLVEISRLKKKIEKMVREKAIGRDEKK